MRVVKLLLCLLLAGVLAGLAFWYFAFHYPGREFMVVEPVETDGLEQPGAESLPSTVEPDAALPPGFPREIAQADELNSKCRGGGDNPKTWQACEQRDAVVDKLYAMGWCYGRDDQIMADRSWQRCGEPAKKPRVSNQPKKAPAKPETVREKNGGLDYSKPIYTTRDAVICPIDIFFDRRASRSAEAAERAALALFDREEKLQAIGCEVWRPGIRLYINSSNEGRVWQEFSLRPDTPTEGLFAMGYYLTNESQPKPSPVHP